MNVAQSIGKDTTNDVCDAVGTEPDTYSKCLVFAGIECGTDQDERRLDAGDFISYNYKGVERFVLAVDLHCLGYTEKEPNDHEFCKAVAQNTQKYYNCPSDSKSVLVKPWD